MLGLTECLLIGSLDEGKVKDAAVKCTRGGRGGGLDGRGHGGGDDRRQNGFERKVWKT